MSVSCKRGAHFQKFVFFMLGLNFYAFLTFWDALGTHFGEPKWSQNGFEIESKNGVILGWCFERP